MDGIRIRILQIVVVLAALIVIGRLFYIQVVDSRYKAVAENNVLRYEIQYPPRGEIYDRNGEFLVQSKEAYDLLVVPRDVKEAFDTVLMCSILGVDTALFNKEFRRARTYSARRPSVLFKQLSKEIKLRLEERHFPGFYTRYRTIRSYPRKIAGNLLGEVGEVGPKMLESDPWYRQGDYTGISGIEQAYEEHLRGEKGVQIQMVDVHGVPKGSYADGAFDSLPKPGPALTCTIDAGLQELAEYLLAGKVGSAMAIEPATGEILAMVSSPTFDPDLLVGRQRGNNYMKLLEDRRQPLFNRAVKSRYPPGSTFKLVNALIGLQEGTLTPSTTYACSGGANVGRFLKCHDHSSPLDLSGAIQTSCNPYFAFAFRNFLDSKGRGATKDRYDLWYDYVRSFGFGRRLDSDFTNENGGSIPNRTYFDEQYHERWNSLTVVSLSIGQGEIGVSMLQMANFIATIANRGHYYIPHVVKAIEGEQIDPRFREQHTVPIDRQHFETVAQAMWRAVNVSGTAFWAQIPGWDVCGKTGTAQNPPYMDHSTFACFAPLNNPKIAVSVYIENGGFGATIALPIARLMLEKYLTGEVSDSTQVEYCHNYTIAYPYYDRQR